MVGSDTSSRVAPSEAYSIFFRDRSRIVRSISSTADGVHDSASPVASMAAGVDVKSKEALLRVVENKRREGKAILVVSGELEDLRTCDRVLIMRHGAVVAEHEAGWSDNALVASIEGI